MLPNNGDFEVGAVGRISVEIGDKFKYGARPGGGNDETLHLLSVPEVRSLEFRKYRVNDAVSSRC